MLKPVLNKFDYKVLCSMVNQAVENRQSLIDSYKDDNGVINESNKEYTDKLTADIESYKSLFNKICDSNK